MIENSVDRLSSLGIWAPQVPQFLLRTETLQWLERAQKEGKRSDDEIVLLLLCAMRSLDLTVLDGGHGPEELAAFLASHDSELRQVCLTKHVQANVAERGLPVLELLAKRWGHRRLSVLELGCSFGLIGRVLLSAPAVLKDFERYFVPTQQRPSDAPLVARYHGIDLDPPDEHWFLACIPLAELRTRMARFIFEIPADPHSSITKGSAFDTASWPEPEEGTVPVILTSFFLYQLSAEQREALVSAITAFVGARGGTWVNLDVLVDDGKARFVIQEDGVDRVDLENDFCRAWRVHG